MKKKKEQRRAVGMKFYHFILPQFNRNGEIYWCFFLLDLDPSGLTGLEPAASALTGRCSDQLNYNPGAVKCTEYLFLWFHSNNFIYISINIDVLEPRREWDIDIHTDIHFSESGTDSFRYCQINWEFVFQCPNEKKKKRVFFCVTLFFLLDFMLSISWSWYESRSLLARSEFMGTNKWSKQNK